MKKLLLYIFLTTITTSVALCQQQSAINDSISFDAAILLIEQQSDYHFYYSPEWIKNLYLKGFPKNVPPESTIRWIAQQASLNYSIINSTNVIFTKDYQLKTNFAENYNNYLENKYTYIQDTVIYEAPKENINKKGKISKEYQLFKIGSPSRNINSKVATLSGKITDEESGEPLVGTVVYIDDLKNGTVTNLYGFYSVALPKGRYKIEYRSVGMKTTYRNIVIYSDGKMDIQMMSTPQALREVTITAKSEDPVRNLSMGMEKLTMKTLKQLPLGMGEADVIKSTLLLPGVQSVGEAANGFNVRGGSTDQNLILLNDASIINTSHFFGLFSAFYSDLVKDITLYKSGIPAKYGGRVSSVMDISLREGNYKKYKVSGGISPVSGRIVAEGPIIKDKASFIIGGRTTYSDWVLRMLDDGKLKNSNARFYDLQGNLSYNIDKKNSIYASGYYSYDNFDYYTEDAYEYTTLASTIKWKHIFSPKLFNTTSAILSNYDYNIESRTDSSSLCSIKYKLNQYTIKSDYSYITSKNHQIDFGVNAIWYKLLPGTRTPIGESTITAKTLEKEQALEGALYISDKFDVTDFMSLSAGLRYSLYSNFGPKTQYKYESGTPRTEESISDTIHYGSGPISFYSGPEFRLCSNIKLSPGSSMKIGFNRMYQYIQMISNTAAMSPTDIWMLSNKYLKPQRGDQYSIGFYKDLRNKTIEASIETYYKSLKNIIDYKGGAQLTMNEHLETDVLNGKGKAYGIELMLQKKSGRFTGFMNYTYSRVFHKIDGYYQEEQVNNGEYFPANYDKPHDFKLVSNYKITRRLNFSTNFMYSTGRPFTAPAAYYELAGAQRVYYTDRNSVRMPDYMRWDLAATINGNLKKHKFNHSSWTFAIYNVLGRKNVYNIFFRTEDGEVKGYKMSIFGQPIFVATYNFKLFGNASDDF